MTLPDTLSNTTRLWVYQANKPFPSDAVPEIRSNLRAFARQWVSHNRQLKGQINDHTLVFDTLVESKAAFDAGWLKPLSESWHARLV